MNAKRFLLLLPTLLMPYFAIASLFIIFFSTKNQIANYIMESVFKGNALLLLVLFAITVILSVILSCICSFVSIKNKWEPLAFSKTVMIIKLIQIPAFIIIFILSLAFMLTIFTIPFAIALFFLDVLALLSTGFLNIAAIITASRNGAVSFKDNLGLAVLQFVFCADVVASVIFYIRLKKKQNG